MRRFAIRGPRSVLRALILLVVGLTLLTGCVAAPPPTQSVEELANALAAVWATQTAVAGLAGAPAPASETPVGGGGVPAGATQAVTEAPPAPPTVPPTATTLPVAPVATLTLAPTATPRPAAATTPVCSVAVDAALAPAWRWETLGCPLADAETVWAAWEPFERGAMLWRSDEDAIYALFANGANPDEGPVSVGGAAWAWDGSHPAGRDLAPPVGNYEPVRGFGRVWFEFLNGPTGPLGWATAVERGICVTLQPFESGFVVKSDNGVRFCKDDLLNMATEPGFTPVFVTVENNAWWRRIK